MKKLAFTLAEIMIVLAVIAIITAILLPSARNAMPNEDLMKFKKAHNALYSAISELVNSDRYYLNGEFGEKADGTVLNKYQDENARIYFIQTFADVLSVSYLSPQVHENYVGQIGLFEYDCMGANTAHDILEGCSGREVTSEIFEMRKDSASNLCYRHSSTEAKQVVTSDGIWFWDARPETTFGKSELVGGTGRKLFHLKDNNGFYALYKTFCMDIDGVPENATRDNCVNECPFTYGISIDGKIFTSGRVDEWLEKSIQDKD